MIRSLETSGHTIVSGSEGYRMRGHVPSNEVTAAGYSPIYHDTKARMEEIFGARNEQHWPAGEQTCSNCYSVTPAVSSSQQ